MLTCALTGQVHYIDEFVVLLLGRIGSATDSSLVAMPGRRVHESQGQGRSTLDIHSVSVSISLSRQPLMIPRYGSVSGIDKQRNPKDMTCDSRLQSYFFSTEGQNM